MNESLHSLTPTPRPPPHTHPSEQLKNTKLFFRPPFHTVRVYNRMPGMQNTDPFKLIASIRHITSTGK